MLQSPAWAEREQASARIVTEVETFVSKPDGIAAYNTVIQQSGFKETNQRVSRNYLDLFIALIGLDQVIAEAKDQGKTVNISPFKFDL